ncbi:MAG: hypothetical protein JST16_14745 [Bdellovibrionales bacterium]|nr:hypothetical protein [Bdellovibrionales bacterium]
MRHLLLIVLIIAAIGEIAARAESGRTKVIDFENSVVEGINRQPYDSLNQVSDAQKRKNRPHLYRKRAGFSTEIRETLSEMRFAQ